MAITTREQTTSWLRYFGYLGADNPTNAEHDEAVARMQRVYGLKEDGIAGPITRRAMGLFRCARPDHNIHTGVEAIRVDAGHCRWKKKEVTYAVHSTFALGGSRNTSLSIVRSGFKVYEPLTGLTFREVAWDKADIQISSGRGAKYSFDGPGNVLAWAEMPCEASDVRLTSMFDDQEPWNLKTTGPGVIMLAVWLHELGHLLGLEHSATDSDLMAPYYNPQIIYPQSGDKSRLAKLYGVEVDHSADGSPVPGLPYGAYNVSGTMVLGEGGAVAINFKQAVRSS